jgi:hypothetical protein
VLTDYEIDWANPAILPDGDGISESTWDVSSGSGLEIGEGEHAPAVEGTKTRVWLSGGNAGWRYADNTVLTADGRRYVRSLRITVTEL